ncbi:MAG: hypothetical protein ACXVRV_14780, partial [Gaiellaceae bacterium]
RSFRGALRGYVEDMLGSFRSDERILAWDLYNEPQPLDATVALVSDAFAWARVVAPSQPLTSCWYGTLLSDIVSIHFYTSPTREPDAARRLLDSAQSYGRPVVATEALGRPNNGELHEILPVFTERQIGWYLWELMIGADQTRYQWPDAPPVDDAIVFQGLLFPDGTPYSADEVELIRATAP